MSQELVQEKGIWIEKDKTYSNYYTTWLDKKRGQVIGFVPFDHSYEPMYLGGVGFLDIARELDKKTSIAARLRTDYGLLQNHFYPLGGTPGETRPLLLGKGLARRIELEIARDLLGRFAQDTPIVIGATSDSHLLYCERVGFVPFRPMAIREYFEKLNH